MLYIWTRSSNTWIVFTLLLLSYLLERCSALSPQLPCKRTHIQAGIAALRHQNNDCRWTLVTDYWGACPKRISEQFRVDAAAYWYANGWGVLAMLFALGPSGGQSIERVGVGTLVALQSFRIAVEIVLTMLYHEAIIPVQMTLEGYTWDIITGLTFPPGGRSLCYKCTHIL
jgi:hypothetical protein